MSVENKNKFDVVIGNPPYQAPKKRSNDKKLGSCGTRLWPEFVKLSIDIVKDEGYVCLVHPSLWRKPENKLFSHFKDNNLIHLDIHSLDDGIKTFKASTRYDWYVVQKGKYRHKTTIVDEDKKTTVIDLSKYDFIPNCDFKLLDSIIAKDDEETCEILYSSSAYETRKKWMKDTETCEVLYSRGAYGSDRDWMNDKETQRYKYPCVYMITKSKGINLWYSSKKDIFFDVPKIIISENGGHLGTLVDNEGQFGLTQFMFAITINSDIEGRKIEEAITSDKFKKVWKSIQWMSNHREWRVFKSFRKDFWKEFV